MAFDPNNPPSLIASGIGGSRGLKAWAWKGTDPIATVIGTGYIRLARKLHMGVGDAVRYVDGNNDPHHLVLSAIDADTGWGTVSFPETAPEAYPVDGSPSGEIYVVAYVDGVQVRVDPTLLPVGVLTFASQAEAEAGVATDKAMNALRVAQAIDAQVTANPDIASQAEAEAGVDNVDMMTALRTKQAIDALSPPNASVTEAKLATSLKGKLVTAAATLAALAALSATTYGAADLMEAGKKGLFYPTTDNISAMVTLDTLKGIYVPFDTDATGASGGWVRQGVEEINPKWFGAAWDDVADDQPELVVADLMARTLNKMLRLPAGTAYIATTLKFTCKWVKGYGQQLSLLRHASVAQPAVLIEPSTLISSDNAFHAYTDFGIVPGASTTNDIKVLLSDAAEYFSNFRFERLYLGPTTGYALLFDNTINNVNGIFSGKVEDCYINSGNGGIRFINGGDSVTLRKCGINGNGIAILGSFVTGARQVLITECNITTLSECIYISGTVGVQIISNWMETPYYLGSYTGASGALCYLEDATNTRIEKNTIQPLDEVGGGFVGANYSITLAGTGADNIIDDNDIADGVLGHINITASTITDTIIGSDNRYAEAAVITDAGLGTRGVWKTPTLTNSWVAFDAPRTPKYKLRPDGAVEFKGALKDGTLGTSAFTLPADIRPVANRLIATMANNGAADIFASFRVLPDGTCSPTVGHNGYFSIEGLSFQQDT